MELLDEKLSTHLDFLDNEYVSIGLSVGLAAYGSILVNDLPEKVLQMLDNIYIKILLFLVVILISRRRKTPVLAIVFAICLVLTLQTLDKHKIDKKMKNIADHGKKQQTQILEPYDPSIINSEMLESFDNVSEVLGYDKSEAYKSSS